MAKITADPTKGVIISVDKVHYAVMNVDKEGEAPTYGDIKPLPQAKSIGVTSNDSQQTAYYDGKPTINATSKGTKDVTFVKAEFSEEDLASFLGCEMMNGVLVEGGDDSPPYIALGFRAETTKGHRYIWLVKGTMSIPDINAATKEANITFQDQTIKGTFISRSCDSSIRLQVNKIDDDDTEAFADEWFSLATLQKLYNKDETPTPPAPDPED